MPPSDNKSIRDFFKPAQPGAGRSESPALRASQPSRPSPNLKAALPPRLKSASVSPSKPVSSRPKPVEVAPVIQETLDLQSSSLRLSPPPPSSIISGEGKAESPKEYVPPSSKANIKPDDREIQASDDEDDDSDSSLADLSTILAAKSAEQRGRNPQSSAAPSTPKATRYQKKTNFHVSPLPVLTKYKFNLESLVAHAKKDEATEASSKRVKAMLSAKDDVDHDILMPDQTSLDGHHRSLLDSVVGEGEKGVKVDRALKRTEATNVERRWYFFDTQEQETITVGSPFPTSSLPKSWRRQLQDPETRYQTFISGFAEDMVSYGKLLPDELLIWMLDEICLESSDPLRASYLNVLKRSSDQVNLLMLPDRIERLFRLLGATPTAIAIKERIIPVSRLTDPYPHKDWSNLISVIHCLGRHAPLLQQSSRTQAICLLLRLSVDRLSIENFELHDSISTTIAQLCLYTSEEGLCDISYQEICKNMYESIAQPTLRLQILQAIPSTHPSSHDLRRRLAMCFYFNNLTYTTAHSHTLTSLHAIILRLHHPIFEVHPQTDFRSLTSLIHILDIAVDDGLSVLLNFSDPSIEEKFNSEVDDLVQTIRKIVVNIGTPGARFISRVEAKEALELVSQRIENTMRTRRKKKKGWFDEVGGRGEEDLKRERAGMASFVKKMKGVGSGVRG